jgi:hypothetical protein
MGEGLDISWKVIRVGQVCMLLSGHSSNSSICMVSVFPDIPAKAFLSPFYVPLIVALMSSQEFLMPINLHIDVLIEF